MEANPSKDQFIIDYHSPVDASIIIVQVNEDK